MNSNQLQNFISIAQTLNFSTVAKSAFISQPALTKQINRLESELGVVLFDRSSHGVSLTYAGEEFYRFAVDILDGIRQAENRMLSIQAGQTGFVKISSVYGMENLISSSISRFNEQYPDVSVNVMIGTGASQIMSIRKMSYDVFFSFSGLLDSFPDLLTLLLPDDRFAIYIHKKFADLYREGGVEFLNSIKHFMEASSEGPFLTNISFSIMNALELSRENIVYYPSTIAIMVAIQAGLGFTLLPTQMNMGAIPPEIEVIPLEIPEAVIHRSFGWHKDNKSIAVKNFAEMMR